MGIGNYKINLLLNVKKRTVVSDITVEQFIDTMKNPDNIRRTLVDEARQLDKNSSKYKLIKESLPCIVPTYRHNEYVKTSTIQDNTGIIYIDVDNQSDSHIKPSDFPYIVAKWTSLSGKGSGYFVRIDNYDNNTSLEYLKNAVSAICTDMGIEFDSKAISRDRLNIIGYDENIYFNPKATPFNIKLSNSSNTTQSNTKNNHPVSISNNINRLSKNEHFYSKEIRLSNFDEMASEISFEEGEVFIDLLDDRIHYLDLFIPSRINNGKRNGTLFGIASSVFVLNPNIEPERLYGFMNKVNLSVCEEPLSEHELSEIVNKIYNNKKIEMFSNKSRRFIFNEEANLTGTERRSIATTQTNIHRGKKTTTEIEVALENWDFEKNGKLTAKKLSEVMGVGYSTIRRRNHFVKDRIKQLNEENFFKKVA